MLPYRDSWNVDIFSREGSSFPSTLLCFGCLVAECDCLFCCVIIFHPQEIAEGLCFFFFFKPIVIVSSTVQATYVPWTAMWLCVCAFVFPDSLQSLFLIVFVPPAGAPGRERHCQRLTVSSHTGSPWTNVFSFRKLHRSDQKSLLVLYSLISCCALLLYPSQLVRSSLILRWERRQNLIMNRWVISCSLCLYERVC